MRLKAQLTAQELASLLPADLEREQARSKDRWPYLSKSELAAEVNRWCEAGKILQARARELTEFEKQRRHEASGLKLIS